MRSNAYCGNLLWQSSLTLRATGKFYGRNDAEDGGYIWLSGRDWFETNAAWNRQWTFGNLRSQIATSKRGGARYKPYVFTVLPQLAQKRPGVKVLVVRCKRG